MKKEWCKYLILLVSLFIDNGYAQPYKEIYCSTDTCSSNFTPIENFDKIFYSSYDLGNENREDYIRVRVDDNQAPRSLRIYTNSETREFPSSIDINLTPTNNQYNASDSIVIGDYFNNLFMNLDGYSPIVGRSSSQICADYVERGVYGELSKLEFETARAIDEQEGGNLPTDRCVFSDVQQIQKNAFDTYQCGGNSDYRILTSNEPTVTARRIRGKNKCLGVAFQDVCLSPMVEVTCNWRLRYSSSQSPVENVLIYNENRGELQDALAPYIPPTLGQIFSTWTRFDGGSYYHPAGTIPYGYSQAGAWVYSGGVVRDTVNSSRYIGFTSSEKFDNYEHEATLQSTGTDDDSIGVIIAFTRENNKNHYLLVSRDTGGVYGSSNNWNLVYADGSGTSEGKSTNTTKRRVLISKKISTVYAGYGWRSRTTRVKVKRTGNIIQAWTSNWNTSSYRTDSLIQINLDDYPELWKFKGKKSYGYAAWSQDDSRYYNISFKGGLRSAKILDAQEDKVYEYNSSTGRYELSDSGAVVSNVENYPGSLGDVIVSNGETVNLTAGNTYVYDTLTIEEGGVLNISDGPLSLTKIIVKGDVAIDGLIQGKGSFVGGQLSETSTINNKTYDVIIGQPSGGEGGELREPETGYLGTTNQYAYVRNKNTNEYSVIWEGATISNGVGDPSVITAGDTIYHRAGVQVYQDTIWYQEAIYRIRPETSSDLQSNDFGNGGGAGGQRGQHGHSLLLITIGDISGTGSINLSGGDGVNGLDGVGNVANGAGGGGGAGGSGGNLFIEYGNTISEDLEINLNGGSSGIGGEGYSTARGGTDGEYGYSGSEVLTRLNNNIVGLYGTERELINFQNGKRYWINADGTIVDSKVGEYSQYDNEAESKRFMMLESEYLDKKEKGMLKYMCNNLTSELEEEIVEEPNLVKNSNLTRDTQGWTLDGKSEWKNEKIKILPNPISSDLTILSGETIELSGCNQEYKFKDLIIESGGTLVLKPKQGCIYKLIIQNKLILNGTIITKNSSIQSTSGSFYDTGMEETRNFNISVKTPYTIKSHRGRRGDYGCANADVFSQSQYNQLACDGRGHGCSRFCYLVTQTGTRTTSSQGHHSHSTTYPVYDLTRCKSSPVTIFNDFLKSNSRQSYYSWNKVTGDLRRGCGGKYVYAFDIHYKEISVYSNGVPLFIHAPIIEGSGTIDGRATQYGSGAKVYIRYDYVISDNLNYLVSAQSGYDSYDGFVEIKKTNQQPDLENLIKIPAATQTIATEVGQKYRVTGVFSQAIEESTGSAAQINVYSDLQKENLIKQENISPDGFINPPWLDTTPTYHHFGKIAVGGGLIYKNQSIQGSTRDYGCNNADTFSSTSYNTITCDGYDGGASRCSRFCYKGQCSGSFDPYSRGSAKDLFDKYIKTSSNQQYTGYTGTTGDLRRGCRGLFVYAIRINYKTYESSSNPIKDFRISNKEEERTAVNCGVPFISENNNPISTTPSPHFKIEANTCSDELKAKQDCAVTVRAQPQVNGTHTGYIKMICDDPLYGKKSTLMTEVQVSTNSNNPKESPIRSSYPVENKPLYTDLEGSADNIYPYFKSCNDLLKNGNELKSGKFYIDPDGENGPITPFQVYCDMENDGGGWTLISKVANNSAVWAYNSPYWENDDTYNEHDLELETNSNMKSKAYATVKADNVRLCMINDSNCIIDTVNKSNAKQVFGSYSNNRATGQGRFDIMALTQQNFNNWDNQPYCNIKGYHAKVTHSGGQVSACRYGVIMNNENDCRTADSLIGFGCSFVNGYSSYGVGAQRWNPTRNYHFRGWIWVRDNVTLTAKKLTTRVREPIDFVFQAESTTSVLELRAFQRDYPAYFDNIEVRQVPSNSGPSIPPAQDGLANVQGQDGPGFYDLYGDPEIIRTSPTYNAENYTTPADSDWGMQYVAVGKQCPLYYEKIDENYVTSHVAYDENDERCDDISYKYDPEAKLVEWKNVGFERLPEFGFENISCTLGDCPIKSNVENIDAWIDPTVKLDDDLRGTQQGEGILFIYDANNTTLSAKKGKNAIKGVNDLPSINETRYCYKIQDATSEGAESEFAKDPVVQFRRYNWQAIKVEQTGEQPQEIPDNGKKINLFKKIDSSVRYFLKKELL